MSVLKIFENTPSRPAQGRQDPNVIFFEFAKRSLAGGRGPVAPRGDRAPHGRQGVSQPI